MPSRVYWLPSMVLWFASMGWLFSTKILPTLTDGQPPAYVDLLPKQEVIVPDPVRWSIRWNRKEIGWAENKITRSSDGTGKIVSEVNFEQLPVDSMLQDLLGVVGKFAKPFVGEIGNLDLHVLTNLDFDHYGVLSTLETKVDLGDAQELLLITGHVNGEKLDLRAMVSMGADAKQVFRDEEIHLPPDTLLADSFSPRPQMANLRIGQTWTFQSYQPLMPHNPLTLIQAKVEQEELLEWNGQMVRTRKVAFRRDAGSGISSTRKPISEVWVQRDGTVLRQDLLIANVKVQFLRVEQPRPEELAELANEGSNRSAVGSAHEGRSRR